MGRSGRVALPLLKNNCFMRFKVTGLLVFLLIVNTALSQNKAEQMRRTDKDSFSVILLSDPQNYIKYDYNQPIFELMTAWIKDNIDSLAVRAVLCTGDLVDQNECLVQPHPRFGNIPSIKQWQAVSHAFERIDNEVPYIISTGNHDYGYLRAENSMTRFPEFFPVTRNSCWDDCLVSVCNNRNGVPTLENSAYEFNSETWGKLLLIALEFAPGDSALEWAKELAASEKYLHHKVIVMTHSYLNAAGRRIEKESYLITPANYGQQVWEKLVYPSSNIFMVICGHYAKPTEKMKDNVGFSIDKNQHGKKVFQMMFNAQALGGGMSGNGGDGWLRILEFMPDGKTIQVRTYSPLFGFSPTTKEYAWRRESYDEFKIVIDN